MSYSIMVSKSLAEIVDDALRLVDEDYNDVITKKYSFPLQVSKVCGVKSASRDRKRVRFSNESLVQVKEIISRLDLTLDEHNAYWWTALEQDQIQERANSLVAYTRIQGKRFASNTLGRAFEIVQRRGPDDLTGPEKRAEGRAARRVLAWVESCNARRGLEQYINSHPMAQRVVADHRQAVILCAIRRGSGSERIRNVSLQFSAVSATLAHFMGKADEHFASKIYL
jgi:hypothetical protein